MQTLALRCITANTFYVENNVKTSNNEKPAQNINAICLNSIRIYTVKHTCYR